MNSSSTSVFILICLILLVNFDLSSQRPNTMVPQTSSVSSPSMPLGPENIIETIEALPAVELLRELIVKQNQLVDTVVPIMIRALTNPVPGLAEALQRSLSLFGVTSYLVGPTIARSARNLGPVVEPLVGSTDSFVKKLNQVTELEPLVQQAMVVLGLDSDECKESIACQAGRQVATDYPMLASYLSQASSTLRPEEDKFAKILIEVMASPNPQCLSNCPNLSTIVKYWKESGEKDLKTVVQNAFDDSISKNPVTSVAI